MNQGKSEKNQQRRLQILGATLRLLRREGAGISTARVAAEANCSKETIYSWFGNREGLFAELVREQSAAMNAALVKAVDGGQVSFEEALTRFGMALLDLLTGEASIAINRAAMAEASADGSPLGDILRANGRETTGKLVMEILKKARDEGRVAFDNVEEAFGMFVGLVMRDTQTLCLIGADARPGGEEMKARAQEAVQRFKVIYSP